MIHSSTFVEQNWQHLLSRCSTNVEPCIIGYCGLFTHFSLAYSERLVDYEKALDSIHRETFWKVMEFYGMPPKFVRMAKYSTTKWRGHSEDVYQQNGYVLRLNTEWQKPTADRWH